MMNVAIILGSTRPGSIGEAVAQWVYKIAQRRTDTDTRFELVDIKDYKPPASRSTSRWCAARTPTDRFGRSSARAGA